MYQNCTERGNLSPVRISVTIHFRDYGSFDTGKSHILWAWREQATNYWWNPPPTFYQANISLIHKADKDPLDPSSYRPISLDVDNKILAKVLATCLEKVFPSVITTDQTGFIKNRLLFFKIFLENYESLFTHQVLVPLSPRYLFLLNAEKTFDRVEWDYLFATLVKFWFGSNFILFFLNYMSTLKLLYKQTISLVIFQ